VSLALSLLRSTLDFAPPLALAALGGVLSERAGVAAIGLEGMMRAGAFCAAWAAWVTGSATTGLAAGVAAGAAFAAVHAWLSLRWRADQVVSGIALNLVALGLFTFLLETVFGTVVTAPREGLPDLRRLAGFQVTTWVALGLPLLFAFALERTPAGLRLTAVGEHPQAAASVGVPVARVRAAAVLLGGALAGLGGAALPLAILHRFDDKMPAGLGFMALAAMVFGRWRPLGALGASLFFALGSALADSLRSALPPGAASLRLDGILLALPYLLALAVLAGLAGRATAPAALGVPFDPEARE
jgi:general nucleoside transport system permease protein